MEYLGLFGLLIVAAAFARWFQRAFATDIPQSFLTFQVVVSIGTAFGIVAFFSGREDPYAGWAIGLGLTYLYLSMTGAQKLGGEMIEVGDAMPAFTATADDGSQFHSSNLANSRVLLKFFRGHW